MRPDQVPDEQHLELNGPVLLPDQLCEFFQDSASILYLQLPL